jgi:hypothetical protein
MKEHWLIYVDYDGLIVEFIWTDRTRVEYYKSRGRRVLYAIHVIPKSRSADGFDPRIILW